MDVLARRENDRIIVCSAGARLQWRLADLTSSDGHAVEATFSATVRPLDEPAERKVLQEAFLTRSATVSADDVAAYFRGALESAARRQAGSTQASALLSDNGQSTLTGKLAEAGRAIAFGCGLEFLPPFDLVLDSPTLRREQEESRRHAAQSERLSRAGGWVKQFQELRASAPELPAGQILARLGGADPADQAELLRALMMAGGKEASNQALWAVAGPNLLRIELDKGNSQKNIEVFEPPADLGPFRSITKAIVDGKTVLVIGARSGVLVIDPRSPNEAKLYADPSIASPMGFNGCIIADGRIWATHGQAGLIGWELGQGQQPKFKIRPDDSAFSPRNLCRFDAERFLLSSEHRLYECAIDGVIRPIVGDVMSPIVAVVPDDQGVLIVHEDGQLMRRERRGFGIAGRGRRSGRVTAAGALPWLGSVRLLLATDEGWLLCVGLEDELITQYSSPYSGLRLAAATAAADRVVGVSADRQRILVWSSWDGRQLAGEIHVASVARHRIADVEFA